MGQLGIERPDRAHRTPAVAWSSRTHPRFLGHAGTLGADGAPLVDGRRWDRPEVAAVIADVAGAGARLVRDDGAERFDVLPLLVATDGAIAAFGHGGRRLRPNIVIGGVEGLAEREWPGGCLRVGSGLIGVQDLRLRCVMTSYDPDTLTQDKEITRSFYRRLRSRAAIRRGRSSTRKPAARSNACTPGWRPPPEFGRPGSPHSG